MLLNKPFGEPSKYAIQVLDFITSHKLPYSPNVPVLYPQDIILSPENYPQKPPDRSQLYRYLHPPEENPWLGGSPIGKILVHKEKELHKLIVKQFKHKLSSEIYNPPLHLTFKWADFGGESETMTKAMEEQKNFNDKHKTWRNQYRVRYCELTDMFYLQVRINHIFPYSFFECDIQDCKEIFAHYWYLNHVAFVDEFEDNMLRYQLVQKSFENNVVKKGISITRVLFPEGQKAHYDNNVLNCRRSNLVSLETKRW